MRSHYLIACFLFTLVGNTFQSPVSAKQSAVKSLRPTTSKPKAAPVQEPELSDLINFRSVDEKKLPPVQAAPKRRTNAQVAATKKPKQSIWPINFDEGDGVSFEVRGLRKREVASQEEEKDQKTLQDSGDSSKTASTTIVASPLGESRHRRSPQRVKIQEVTGGRCRNGFVQTRNGCVRRITRPPKRRGRREVSISIQTSGSVSVNGKITYINGHPCGRKRSLCQGGCPEGFAATDNGNCVQSITSNGNYFSFDLDGFRRKRDTALNSTGFRPLNLKEKAISKVTDGVCGGSGILSSNGVCVTPIRRVTGGSSFNPDIFRKRRDLRPINSDGSFDRERRDTKDRRPLVTCPSGFHLDNKGNCRKKLTASVPVARFSARSGTTQNPTPVKESLPPVQTTTEKDKNAAGDGFGYVSKDCGSLVPGLVSDGAGGCTKSVKPKEKILKVDRRKREDSWMAGQHKDVFVKEAGGIAGRADLVDEDGNKGVATDGFGWSTSKCSSLVPGLVSDGAGGCTKLVKNNKKNKLNNQFTFKTSEELVPTDKKTIENKERIEDEEFRRFAEILQVPSSYS